MPWTVARLALRHSRVVALDARRLGRALPLRLMPRPGGLPGDFWRYWLGETVSYFGSSVTSFALPLVVFQQTRSALGLALTTACIYLPYALFGLPIGALVDRVDRKRLMVVVDVMQSALVASIPAAYLSGGVSVWWIYGVTFSTSTLRIASNSASFAAVTFLVRDKEDLVVANSRLQGSFSIAAVSGPAAAGAALALVSAPLLLFVDAASYLLSALALLSVRTRFDAGAPPAAPATLWSDVRTGVRFVLQHPLLRRLALVAALVNVFFVNTFTQIVLLAQTRLDASAGEVGIFYSAGPAGALVFSLAASRLSRSFGFARLIQSAVLLNGALTLLLASTDTVWVGVVAYGAIMGSATLFTVSTASVRQRVTPSAMLGRVISIAMVLAWSVEPIGAVGGALTIDYVAGPETLYFIVGAALIATALLFARGPMRDV